jgi:uncharacterized protein YceH (UPF0502 family)
MGVSEAVGRFRQRLADAEFAKTALVVATVVVVTMLFAAALVVDLYFK